MGKCLERICTFLKRFLQLTPDEEIPCYHTHESEHKDFIRVLDHAVPDRTNTNDTQNNDQNPALRLLLVQERPLPPYKKGFRFQLHMDFQRRASGHPRSWNLSLILRFHDHTETLSAKQPPLDGAVKIRVDMQRRLL